MALNAPLWERSTHAGCLGCGTDILFFTTVRIDTIADDDAASSVTGFLFAYRVGRQSFRFVVTNRHVVAGMKSGTLTFLQKSGETVRLGRRYQLPFDGWSKAWFMHPSPDVDIAIHPFASLKAHIKAQNSIDLFYRCIETSMIPDAQQMKEIDAIESVAFIGYPNGIWYRKNFLPVARRGATASPIEVDFEGTSRFLIDASVFPGSSGSPVFILNKPSWTNKDGGLVIGPLQLIFIGVIAGGFWRTHLNQLVPVPFLPWFNRWRRSGR